MPSLLTSSLYRLAKALANYRGLGRLALGRVLRRPIVTVKDRRTGLSFRCLRGAERMLGETFHSQVYDVPTAPVRSGDLVIDVGANHGFTSGYFAARGARVVAFEPQRDVFRLLIENLARNRLADRVQAFPHAVGGADGEASLVVRARLGGGMSTTHPGFAAATGGEARETYPVPVVSLCRVLEEAGGGRVRLLKLDCEGSELEILRALEPADRERIDSLAIEYHPEAYPLAELIALLASWESFHVSKVATLDVANANLHAVHRRALAEWSETG